MERIDEFPALEDRQAFLEHALYEATRQNDVVALEGKHDAGGEQWLGRIKAELRELRYALWVLDWLSKSGIVIGSQRSSNKIDVTGRTLLIALVIFVVIMLAQLAILLNVGH